jgi:acetylornithine deacetylase/succinyl-diaminopimelate desuccinylase-like protein
VTAPELTTADAAALVLADAERVCAVPAPTFHEEARAALVEELLREAGCRPRRDEAGNVIGVVGDSGAPVVVFAAHLDTVFGPEQSIEIVHDEPGGRIVGPGIGDNSLGVAALLHLARRFAGHPESPPLVLAATVGEEGRGDLRGAKQLVSDLPCAAFVAIEGATLDRIDIGGVASTRYRIAYRGPGGHSWSDRGTPSAVHGLVARAASFLAEREPAGEVSANIGRIEGGTSINTIAAEATAELDLRSEDPAALEAVASRAREHFAAAPPGLTATVEQIGQRPGGHTAADHPLVEAARRARERAGLPPAAEGTSSTDANAAYGRGIPAITVGVSTGGNAHRPDDYVDVGPVAQGLRALELLAEELAAER